MANTESNPFPEEDKLEDNTEEEILALLALSFVYATSSVNPSSFNPATDFDIVQSRFRAKFSEILPELTSVSQQAIEIAINRLGRDFDLDDLFIDYSDERFNTTTRQLLNENFDRILATNEQFWNRLQQLAIENDWSDEELARRLKKYYGLVPNHVQTVLAMETALTKEGVSKKSKDSQVQKRIDRLVEWRLSLIANQISTGVVEGSKDESFGYLVDTSQINPDEYEKQWVSVIDDVTTDTCISLHLSRAPIGGTFNGGIKHPPSFPPVHPCRSAIRLVKRVI